MEVDAESESPSRCEAILVGGDLLPLRRQRVDVGWTLGLERDQEGAVLDA
jgi:hypothetical protein